MELGAVGFRSPWAFLPYFLFTVAPLVYIYIGLMLLRDLCEYFPESIQQPLQHYAPFLANVVTLMKSYFGFRLVDVWCVIEALFFIACKLKVRYLQGKDPLEASLTAAPMLDADERKSLWDHMMAVDSDPDWITGWFLDHPTIESISRYDIFDFICWAMFDGRNQEHLTTQELQDLESFVEDLEYRISLHLYGVKQEPETPSTLPDDTAALMEEDEEEEEDNDEGDYNNDNERYENNDDDDELILSRHRQRSYSDAATATASNSNNQFDTVEETENEVYSTPLRHLRQVSNGEESTTSTGSGDWSSTSTKRPRPKKCKWPNREFWDCFDLATTKKKSPC
jgi:hypothetical protein